MQIIHKPEYEIRYGSHNIIYVINDIDTRVIKLAITVNELNMYKQYSIYVGNAYTPNIPLSFCDSFTDAKEQFLKVTESMKNKLYFSKRIDTFISRDIQTENEYLIKIFGV